MEKLPRQGDHAIDHLPLNHRAADLALARLGGGHRAIGQHHPRRARGRQMMQDVMQPSVAGIARRADAVLPAPIQPQPCPALATVNTMPPTGSVISSQSGRFSLWIRRMIPSVGSVPHRRNRGMRSMGDRTTLPAMFEEDQKTVWETVFPTNGVGPQVVLEGDLSPGRVLHRKTPEGRVQRRLWLGTRFPRRADRRIRISRIARDAR